MKYIKGYKISSFREGIDYVVIYRDSIGWKMDVYGENRFNVKGGDVYQDNVDELMPFLKLFIDEDSTWVDFDNDEPTSLWNMLSEQTGCRD